MKGLKELALSVAHVVKTQKAEEEWPWQDLCGDAYGVIVPSTREGIVLSMRMWFDETLSTSKMGKFIARSTTNHLTQIGGTEEWRKL
jgi:hypothetical protein